MHHKITRLFLTISCLMLLIVGTVPQCWAQQDNAAPIRENTAPIQADAAPAFSGPEQLQIQEWIDELGANEFAVRERASESLILMGLDVVPYLRKANELTTDPEVRHRTGTLLKQLSHGTEESRIESFLAGKDVEFEGWGIIKVIFGDSPKSRDLFIEMWRSYPEMMTSLDGTSRELVVALESATEKLKIARTTRAWQPQVSDTLVLLLPATDKNVPITAAHEEFMMSLMRRAPANRVRKDKVLGEPYLLLVASWMRRSNLANRRDVLYFAMDWQIRRAYPLALNTLGETTDTEILAHAMQAIAAFGSRHDTAYLLPFLTDSRPASEQRFSNRQSKETQLRDVALVAIAVLNDVDLEEIGQQERIKHDRFGFLYEDVGFPKGDEEKRAAAQKKLREILLSRENNPDDVKS